MRTVETQRVASVEPPSGASPQRSPDDFWSQPRWQGVVRPSVSVIVPTYNRAEFLERIIASIFGQTVSVHELLLVDDGSTDDTRHVVAGLLAKYPAWENRLQYL